MRAARGSDFTAGFFDNGAFFAAGGAGAAGYETRAALATGATVALGSGLEPPKTEPKALRGFALAWAVCGAAASSFAVAGFSFCGAASTFSAA